MGTLDTHAPDDLLVPGLKIVFCGAAANTKAAAHGAYYAEPQNLFWRTLTEVGLTPTQLEPDDYSKLTDYGIGLTWDQPGLDERIAVNAPQVLAFNGLGPARAALGKSKVGAGRYPKTFQGAEVWVLPSTSPAARRTWDEDVWQDFATYVQTLRTAAPAASPAESASAEVRQPTPAAQAGPAAKPKPKPKPKSKPTPTPKAAAKPEPGMPPRPAAKSAAPTAPKPVAPSPPAAPAPTSTPPSKSASSSTPPSSPAPAAGRRRGLLIPAAAVGTAVAVITAIRRRIAG